MVKAFSKDKNLHSYVIGLALGDGNISRDSKWRTSRLRITCDKKYPYLYKYIKLCLEQLLPDNKVSISDNNTYLNVYCYSNRLESLLGWKGNMGSKYKQQVRVPMWITKNKEYTKECLRGLIQTDGSIFFDRKYKMVNFVTQIPNLAHDVLALMRQIGYTPNMQILAIKDNKTKFTIRISKDVDKFIKDIKLWKS